MNDRAGAERTVADAPGDGGRGYAGYVLAILILANTFNSVDRAIVNLLVEPIRHEFGFSDTALGMIGGIGFSLFYALLGLPIARLADRRSRKHILAAGIAFWSAMTMLTGRAVGFWSMFAARVGVGAGEATCYPCALSLIGDYFRPAQRSRAIGLYQIGLNFGFIFGAAIASIIAQRHGWRAAFYVMGLPGLVLAVVVLATVREPVRGAKEGVGLGAGQGHGRGGVPVDGGFREMFGLLVGNRPFMLLVAASACMSTGAATLANWGSAFLMRSHGLTMAEVGVKVGPLIGIGGAIGTVLGGVLGTMIARRTASPYAALKVALYTIIPATPFMALFLLGPTMPLVLVGGVGGGVLATMYYGPLVSVAINLVAPRNRALAGSLLVVGQTLIGFGLGPLIAGALSDWLRPQLGDEALRYAMLIAPVALLTAWMLTFAAWRGLHARSSTIVAPATFS